MNLLRREKKSFSVDELPLMCVCVSASKIFISYVTTIPFYISWQFCCHFYLLIVILNEHLWLKNVNWCSSIDGYNGWVYVYGWMRKRDIFLSLSHIDLSNATPKLMGKKSPLVKKLCGKIQEKCFECLLT